MVHRRRAHAFDSIIVWIDLRRARVWDPRALEDRGARAKFRPGAGRADRCRRDGLLHAALALAGVVGSLSVAPPLACVRMRYRERGSASSCWAPSARARHV